MPDSTLRRRLRRLDEPASRPSAPTGSSNARATRSCAIALPHHLPGSEWPLACHRRSRRSSPCRPHSRAPLGGSSMTASPVSPGSVSSSRSGAPSRGGRRASPRVRETLSTTSRAIRSWTRRSPTSSDDSSRRRWPTRAASVASRSTPTTRRRRTTPTPAGSSAGSLPPAHRHVLPGTDRHLPGPWSHGGLFDELARYHLPGRRDDAPHDIARILDEIEEVVGHKASTPDHIVHVTVQGGGKMCPATEPELPPGQRPIPAQTSDPEAGKDVRSRSSTPVGTRKPPTTRRRRGSTTTSTRSRATPRP